MELNFNYWGPGLTFNMFLCLRNIVVASLLLNVHSGNFEIASFFEIFFLMLLGWVKRGDFCFLISHLYRYFIIFHVSGNILFKSIIWIITRPSLVSNSKCKVQFNVPAGNYMFKVNNRNTRTRYIFIINFEHVSQVVLLFLL